MGTVVGLCETRDQASRAVEELRAAGLRDEEISLVMRDRRQAEGLADDVDLDSENATAAGAVGGGILGALAGLALGAGAIALPGIGPILAMGPIVAGVTGVAIGVTTGGLIGTLIDWGVPEHEAAHYHSGVERGGILLAARVPDDREAEARAALARAGVSGVEEHRRRWEGDPSYRYETTDAH